MVTKVCSFYQNENLKLILILGHMTHDTMLKNRISKNDSVLNKRIVRNVATVLLNKISLMFHGLKIAVIRFVSMY